MVKNLLAVVLVFVATYTQAQYCGNSGTYQCTTSVLAQPWLTPHPDSLPAFVNGQPANTTIFFKNFNTVYFGGGYYTVNSLRIDTVDNLPPGLCWASNKPNNTYANQESGCIQVSGVPCGPTGQYKMRIIVTVDLGFGNAQVDADQAGLKYYVRLKNSGDADVQVDSTQTAANAFIPYGGSCGALPLNAFIGNNTSVCSGSIATLQPVISGGAAPYTYAWSATGNTLSCNNCANPSATITQNSMFTVTVTDANNNTVTDTISYTVTGGSNNFTVTTGGATTFCQGNAVQLTGSSGGSYSYQWLKDNVNIAGATTLQLTAGSSGNYRLLYYNNLCYATSNIVNINTLQAPNAVATAQPATACTGDTITLSAQADTSINQYQWLLGNTTAGTAGTFKATTGGTYKLVVKNTANCYDTTTINLTFKALPQVSLTGNADTTCTNSNTVTLSGGVPAGGTYSGPGVTGAAFSPVQAGAGVHTITYTYTDTAGCSNTANEAIVVDICAGIKDITAQQVQLYPNPVHTSLTVTGHAINNTTTLQVTDATGKTVDVPYSINGTIVRADVQLLAKGLYFITIKTNNSTQKTVFMKAD
jgi:hypothetical protein